MERRMRSKTGGTYIRLLAVIVLAIVASSCEDLVENDDECTYQAPPASRPSAGGSGATGLHQRPRKGALCQRGETFMCQRPWNLPASWP